jgi:hypothetical protein
MQPSGYAKALKTQIVVITTRFLYEYILTKFGYSLIIATNQRIHFITDIIKHIIKYFWLKNDNSTTYYPQGNGQAKSTNKIIDRLLTNLINVKRID